MSTMFPVGNNARTPQITLPGQERNKKRRDGSSADGKLPASLAVQQAVINMFTDRIPEISQLGQLRNRFLLQDRQYARELDWTQKHLEARRANLNGDPRPLQNVTVPVAGPQVESALTTLSEIYLTSYPMFPVVAPPEMQEFATSLETLIGESAIQFQYPLHLQRALRDGLKHNLLAVDTDWKSHKVGVKFSDPLDPSSDRTTIAFEGTEIKHVPLYNAFFDTRVMPCEQHTKAEFCGYSEVLSMVNLKQWFLDQDPSTTMNSTKAFESRMNTTQSSAGRDGFFVPQINPDLQLSQTVQDDWMVWGGKERSGAYATYSGSYEVTYLYWRVIPESVGMHGPNGNKPSMWKFTIVNRQVVVQAKQIVSMDDSFPMVVGQLVDDGHGWTTKSFQDLAVTYQQLASSMYNSGLASQRRKVYDRLFYDPSRINKRDIDNTDVIARIPIKQEAYGSPLSEAVWQAPYRDDGVAETFAVGRELTEMADVATGQNRMQRGQFQKGNKTRFEVSQVMGNSDARPRLMATVVESGFFQPIKYKLRANLLERQKSVTVQNRDSGQPQEISPQQLRTTMWQFQMGDGMLPVDKLVNMDVFGSVMQLAAAQPAFAMEYDLVGMANYMFTLQGAKWVNGFKRSAAQQQTLTNQMSQINGNQQPGPKPAGPSALPTPAQ